MSDNEANRRTQQQIERELAEAEANKQQLILDRWVQSQRDLEDEVNDTYMVGGFQERWSKTPSFIKGRRDRDWRVR
jgi:hypothetical protein